MKKKIIFGIVLGVLILVLIAAAYLYAVKEEREIVVNNFAECAAAGFAVMESYPRKCNANGQIFVEDIDGKKYISNDPVQCETIRFVCEEGREAFFDETGCGCEENFD